MTGSPWTHTLPKETFRNELEAELLHLSAAWFPRCVDNEYGGFLCDFDFRWRQAGSQPKMLEYQARQTRTAAQIATFAPVPADLREIAIQGFRYLKTQMWDSALGGWYRLLNRDGTLGESATKHGHGMSYAISACVACYELTKDAECIDLAKSAFAWLEEHAHDDRWGGYFVYYHRDGSPILSKDQDPVLDRTNDPIGTPLGFKDANTTSDLLRGLADLYRVWPDPMLKERLIELLCIMRDRFVVSSGAMHMYMSPDWTPQPDFVRYGQVLHSANLMRIASDALFGAVDPSTERLAKSMIDAMLSAAWDCKKGGFHLAGSSFGPAQFDGVTVLIKDKRWWIQAEGLRALLPMARTYPTDPQDYATQFLRLWDYVKRYLIDKRHGGWFASGLDTNPNERRRPKANRWKDPSHEVEALLHCLGLLNSSE